MCGRADLSSDVSEIKIAFGIPPERPTPNIAPSWNVAPTDPLPVVRYDTKVPVDVFYEWQKTAAGKQPYAIGLKGGELMALAGGRTRAQLRHHHHRAERALRRAA
jgi:putative SOS response-associated peptidase YedK